MSALRLRDWLENRAKNWEAKQDRGLPRPAAKSGGRVNNLQRHRSTLAICHFSPFNGRVAPRRTSNVMKCFSLSSTGQSDECGQIGPRAVREQLALELTFINSRRCSTDVTPMSWYKVKTHHVLQFLDTVGTVKKPLSERKTTTRPEVTSSIHLVPTIFFDHFSLVLSRYLVNA